MTPTSMLVKCLLVLQGMFPAVDQTPEQLGRCSEIQIISGPIKSTITKPRRIYETDFAGLFHEPRKSADRIRIACASGYNMDNVDGLGVSGFGYQCNDIPVS